MYEHIEKDNYTEEIILKLLNILDVPINTFTEKNELYLYDEIALMFISFSSEKTIDVSPILHHMKAEKLKKHKKNLEYIIEKLKLLHIS